MGIPKTPEAEQKVQPESKHRAGSMSVSVWKNEGKKGDKSFTFKTLTLQRSYKDSKDVWQNPSLSLRLSDVSKAILVLQKAYEDCVLNKEAEEQDE